MHSPRCYGSINYYSASGREAEYCEEHVCLSVCLSVCSSASISPGVHVQFVHVAVRYVGLLSVLRMTLYLHIMGHGAVNFLSAE